MQPREQLEYLSLDLSFLPGSIQHQQCQRAQEIDLPEIRTSNTVYVKTFEGENFRGSSTMCIM